MRAGYSIGVVGNSVAHEARKVHLSCNQKVGSLSKVGFKTQRSWPLQSWPILQTLPYITAMFIFATVGKGETRGVQLVAVCKSTLIEPTKSKTLDLLR